MADEFVMPKLGLTMESGTIKGWLVDDGAEVRPGQAVLVIETDKVESEVEAIHAGRLHQVGRVGQEYPCGASIGWVLADGEQPPEPVAGGATDAAPAAVAAQVGVAGGAADAAPAAVAATGVGGRLLASPNAKRVAAERDIDLRTLVGSGPGGRITSEDVPATASGPRAPAIAAADRPHRPDHHTTGLVPGGALATAAARNLAELLGVDIRLVAPAGADPRVTREDVAAHVRALLAAAAAAPPTGVSTPAPAAPLQEPTRTIPLTGMRGTIARRMIGSLHSMAQLTLTLDVDMGGVVADRSERRSRDAEGPIPGYTDYVIAAVAAALVEHPVVNSQITDDGLALLPTVNIGLAVALDAGLIVPVVHDAPSLTLEDLAARTARLATAARAGTLTLPELEGGTFSVTTLGMYDVDGFTPIINAPNTAILGVGRVRDDLSWSEDATPVRTDRLTLSLTWDHRAFDGVPAARFARSVKRNLEGYGRS